MLCFTFFSNTVFAQSPDILETSELGPTESAIYTVSPSLYSTVNNHLISSIDAREATGTFQMGNTTYEAGVGNYELTTVDPEYISNVWYGVLFSNGGRITHHFNGQINADGSAYFKTVWYR